MDMTNETTAATTNNLEWQMEKLRNRLDKAMNGYTLQVCALTLADLFYGAMAATCETPKESAMGVLELVHAARQPKVEESRIVVP
jgi:hypothetical protein